MATIYVQQGSTVHTTPPILLATSEQAFPQTEPVGSNRENCVMAEIFPSFAALHPPRSLYVAAHPLSDTGDPNCADRIGYELVSVRPDGLMIYANRGGGERSVYREVDECQ